MERLRTFVLSRPLPPNELSVCGKQPLRPFSTRRIFNALERMQEDTPECMSKLFSPEVFASIVQDLEGSGKSEKLGGSVREEERLGCEVTPHKDYSQPSVEADDDEFLTEKERQKRLPYNAYII